MLEDTENLTAGEVLDLSNTVGVAEDGTDLARGVALLGVLHDDVNNIASGGLAPGSRGALEGQSRLADTLPEGVHTTHVDGLKG